MARGAGGRVVVGADRIAANGDVANKVGTYPLAVLAARHGIPFYVAAPRLHARPRHRHAARTSRSRSATRPRCWARRTGGRRAQPGLRRDPAELVARRDHRGGRAAAALRGVDRAGGRLMDAERLLSDARRPLCIGIGGGGDVVGALATGEACRLYAGAEPVVGGVTWERRPIDPLPGPRARRRDRGRRASSRPACSLRPPDTRVRASGVRFAEARMAEFLGEPTVLVDVNEGPATLARGLGAAAERLDCDLLRARGRGRRRARPRRRARAGQPALRRADAGRGRAGSPRRARCRCSPGCSASAATAS